MDPKMDTTTADGRADISVMETARECARTRKSLIAKMRALSRSLQVEADLLEANAERLPNSLGIVQDDGREIDRLAAIFNAQMDAWKRAIWIAKGEEK
jgi:cell shape-determining protein MreC